MSRLTLLQVVDRRVQVIPRLRGWLAVGDRSRNVPSVPSVGVWGTLVLVGVNLVSVGLVWVGSVGGGVGVGVGVGVVGVGLVTRWLRLGVLRSSLVLGVRLVPRL